MRVVVALGGNALLRRDQPLTAQNQRANVQIAARALAQLVSAGHQLVIAHGNGPQVGLPALQGAAYKPDEAYPLDVLGAETEGMIGYLIEQELRNLLPHGQAFATILTQIEVDPNDPAFMHPSKPIGPGYSKAEAEAIGRARGWTIARDGERYRRAVASPSPKRILEFKVIELLMNHGVIVICAGGGGIPTIRRADGSVVGVEAVIDKDQASELLARSLKADVLLLLTDVDSVYAGWGTSERRAIRRAAPAALERMDFASGSMGPKVQAACKFAEAGQGFAGIGRLEDALAILDRRAGTIVAKDVEGIVLA